MLRKNNAAAMAMAIAACMLSTPAAAQVFGSPQDLREITAIETAMATETDVDKVIGYYADNAILADIFAPGWYQGRDQIHAAAKAQLDALKAIKFRMDEISIASDGKFACAAMLLHFDATRKNDSPLTLSIRQLDAFKKIDGHWRVIHQHLSVPVEQKTATPLFDAAVTPRGPLAWSSASALDPAVPEAQARTEIMAWLTASEIPKNIDEMAGFYGPGEDNIIFDWWSPRESRGHQELRDYYGPSLAGVKNLEIKIPAVTIDTDGAFGVEVSQQHLKMNMQDGTSQLISFRQSDCVRRVGGKWYSFFEMGSFPVDGATGKAIMVNPAAFK
ncbi:MAG: nuclear transport factor 2 family protein [Sphingomonadales bacterium]|nr:nuclear transport factor 2 family protein [Sphingomonadales bacterium]